MRSRKSEEAMIRSAPLVPKLLIAWGIAVVLIISLEGVWGLPFPPSGNTLQKILVDSLLGIVGAVVGLSTIGWLRRQIGKNWNSSNK